MAGSPAGEQAIDAQQHWDAVYALRGSQGVSWFQPEAEVSRRLIARTGVARDAPLIDVGGGASVLADELLAAGHTALSVLDLSAQALQAARARLGPRADAVRWIQADITCAALPAAAFEVWHDRAVFHFLTAAADRQAYVQAVRRSLRPGGHVIVATFAEDGPPACSDLPVVRYGSAALHAAFGPGFTLQHTERQLHHTPAGAPQAFTWCVLRFQDAA